MAFTVQVTAIGNLFTYVYITPIWLLCWTDQSGARVGSSTMQINQSNHRRSARPALLENNSPSLFIFRASVRELLVLPSAFKQIDPDSLNKHTSVLCGANGRRNCTLYILLFVMLQGKFFANSFAERRGADQVPLSFS